MLLSKIKCIDRSEVEKWIFGKKSYFKYGGQTYYIKPENIYVTYKFFKIFSFRTIDYVQGNSNPIQYYEKDLELPKISHKNLDTISLIIRNWIQDRFVNFQLIMIILAIAILGISVINLIVNVQNG